MADQTYPSLLPRMSVAGYELQPADALVRTDMEDGTARVRRSRRNAPVRIPVLWQFTRYEYEVFEGWHYSALDEGAEWFDAEIATGQGIESCECRFVGPYRAPARGGLQWDVAATLEVRSRARLSAEELEVALAYDWDEILEAGTPAASLMEAMAVTYGGFAI